MNEVTLTLTEEDLKIIAAALGELPMKFAKPTFDKINSQVAQQMEPASEPDAAD